VDSVSRLDDYIDGRFLVVARDHHQFGSSAGWWVEKGALVCTLDELPDPTGRIDRWMRQSHVQVVVTRPDHYVLAAGDDLDQITALATPWLTRTPPHPVPA
jgi:hypothetical protein